MKKRYTRLSEDEFNRIKRMQELGITPTEATQLSGRSNGTVAVIYRHDTIEGYRAKQAEYRESSLTLREQPKQPELEVEPTSVGSTAAGEADEVAALTAAIELLQEVTRILKDREEPKVAPWYARIKNGGK